MFRVISYLLLVLTVLGGCATAELNSLKTKESLVGASGVMTQLVLHPDMRQKLLYSANYQHEGLIPICTPVKITSMRRSEAVFLNETSGEQFRYVYHKAAGETLELHLQKVFDFGCPKEQISKLSKLDQEGIKLGRVSKRMSKQGVLFAIGYPPPGSTPDRSSPEWLYWQSKFDKFKVYFDGDIVREVKD